MPRRGKERYVEVHITYVDGRGEIIEGIGASWKQASGVTVLEVDRDGLEDVEAMYFGCWGKPGHFLWLPGEQRVPYYVERNALPFPLRSHVLDGGYCPRGSETEGRALLHRVHGFTVLAFWDRSVDGRGKCNSAFVLRGRLTFEEAVGRAKAAFPEVWARFAFEVVEADEEV